MKKTVSIIITNYNRCKFLDRAIRSCFDQSNSRNIDIEVLVVDDGSTDDSLKLLATFEDNIKVIKHEKNLGVAAASNSGIKSCTGDFLLRLDSDDFLSKYSIQILSEILIQNNQYGFVYSDHYRVDEKGFKIEKKKILNNEDLFENGAGVLFRKEIFNEIGFYDESLKNCEDYDFLVRVLNKFKGFYVPIPLYRYYIHGDNISLKEDRKKFKELVKKTHEI